MSKGKNLAKTAGMISILTLISKGLGFLREIMIANRFGSGIETDTYFVAMTATVIIIGTIGAALKTTLIPIFSEVEGRYGRKGKLKFLNNIFNIVFIIGLIVIVLGYIFSPLTIKILAKGFEGEQFNLAVTLNRIGLPIAMFLGLTHVFTGLLDSDEIFGPSAISGIPYNFIFLTYLILVGKNASIYTLMVVTVIAASTQFLILVPAVRHMGYRYRFRINLRDPYLRKGMFLVLPVLIGSAVQQINIVVDRTLASGLERGSISALTYSSRINDMVIAVFIMAITKVIFPKLSRAFAKEDGGEVSRILGQGINIILIITVPATVGLLLLADPLVYLFFQRGSFNARDTLMTSQALMFYSLGLVGFSLRLMLNKVYYSFQDTRTPMINGVIAVGVNLIFNLILIRWMGHSGLALATSISATVTTILLFISLRKKIGPIGLTRYMISFFKTLAASLIMGLVVYFIYFRLGAMISSAKIIQMGLLVVSVGVGAGVYFVLCMVFKVDELKMILRR